MRPNGSEQGCTSQGFLCQSEEVGCRRAESKKPSHFVIQASVLPFAAEIRSYPGPSIPEDPQALRKLQSLA